MTALASLSIDQAVAEACAAVGIKPPARKLHPGVWVRTDTLGKNGRDDGAVLLNDDRRGGYAHNYQTGIGRPFRMGAEVRPATPEELRKRREQEARARQEREVQERAALEACEAILKACRVDRHAYLDAKGFPAEEGLVCDDPRLHVPSGWLGKLIADAMPDAEGKPVLIIPGRVGGRVMTLQLITCTGAKKNILWGSMRGASHRLCSGARTVVCEGFGTALTIREALKLLGIRATVLSAFAASNVERVASAMSGFICADHDRPQPGLGGKGAGEFYAARSGCPWTMPPELGDWNDHHMKHGLRASALLLREALG